MQFIRQPSRVALFGLVSSTVASAVLLHAFSLHSWYFYPACIYISRSSACMMALMNFALFVGLMFGRGVQKVVFGELRAVEVEHLYERSWLAVTETLLAMTIFRDEFDSKFMILFAALMMLKAFHWICADRVDFIEQSPVTQISFHIKLASFMCFLFGVDTAFSTHAVQIIMDKGPNVMLLFGFEYTILSSTMVVTFAKYILHILDMRREEPWENKSVWIFYIEMAHDFFKLVNYIVFFSLILAFYGLPIHIIRDLYLTLRSFLVKVRDLIRYRQATRNMDQRYPNATADDLNRLSDRTCIICREDMWAEGEVRPAGDERPVGNQQRRGQIPKKLPCGHIFHFSCLRSWLERQQSCPTCRRPVLENNNNRGPQVQPAAQQQARPAQPPNAPIRPNAAQPAAPMNQGVFPPVAGPPFNPFVIPANQAPQNQANSPTGSANSTSPTATVSATSSNRRITISFRPPIVNNAATSGTSSAATPPQPPMFLPYMFPMPPLAPHGSIPNLPQQPVLTHLTDEQLQSFLSTTLNRNTLEERIRTLQRVQNQLHGCITAMTQIASTLDVNLHNASPPATSASVPSSSSTSSSTTQSNSGGNGAPHPSSSRDTGSTMNRQFSANITFNTSRPISGLPTSRSPETSTPSSTTSQRESGAKEPTESNKSTSTISDQTSPRSSNPPPYSSLLSSDVTATSQTTGRTSSHIPPSSTSVHSSKPSPWSQQPGTTGSSSSYFSSGGSSSPGSSFSAGYTLGTPPNATALSVGSSKPIMAEKDDAENGASSSSTSDRNTESGDQGSGN